MRYCSHITQLDPQWPRVPRGFTLIELLVVISIIALLIGILLPALGAARESGRKIACASNVKQEALAVIVYTNDHKDRFPLAVSYIPGELGIGELNTRLQANATDSDKVFIHNLLVPYIGGDTGVGEYSDTFRCPSRESLGDLPQFTDLVSNPLHTHYRYNWGGAFWRATTFELTLPSPRLFSHQTSDLNQASEALLIYDTVYRDWPEEAFPHRGGGGRSINTGYVDGHVDSVGSEDYLDRTSRFTAINASWANDFFQEFWPYGIVP